eukprot:COSAG02_NODE_3202_length_7181_cov_25.177210_4_plen_101_part_00
MGKPIGGSEDSGWMAELSATQTWRPISAVPTPPISSPVGHVQPSLKRASEKLLTCRSYKRLASQAKRMRNAATCQEQHSGLVVCMEAAVCLHADRIDTVS